MLSATEAHPQKKRSLAVNVIYRKRRHRPRTHTFPIPSRTKSPSLSFSIAHMVLQKADAVYSSFSSNPDHRTAGDGVFAVMCLQPSFVYFSDQVLCDSYRRVDRTQSNPSLLTALSPDGLTRQSCPLFGGKRNDGINWLVCDTRVRMHLSATKPVCTLVSRAHSSLSLGFWHPMHYSMSAEQTFIEWSHLALSQCSHSKMI